MAETGRVTFLVLHYLQCGRYVQAINADSDHHGHNRCFFNEIPVLFLFAIVLLVLKPGNPAGQGEATRLEYYPK